MTFQLLLESLIENIENLMEKEVKLTPEQKLEQAFRLYFLARDLKKAALRQAHPDWTEEELEQKIKEIFLYAGD